MNNKIFTVAVASMLIFGFAFADIHAADWLAKTTWRLVYVDSEQLPAQYGAAINAFDGNLSTIWHTQYYPSTMQPPHEIQIDLGRIYSIEGFRYTPRQDGSMNGRIANYEFYVSTDSVTWGNPVATGTFANNATVKEINWEPQAGQYIRLRALTEVNGNPWSSMAEIDVLGSVSNDNQAPDGTIISPFENISISAGDQVSFSGSGSDQEGDLPLSYHWTFGSGSGIPDSNLQNPGDLVFSNPGTYIVTLTVTDALGNVDPTPETRTITVSPISVSIVIPHTGWSLNYTDSQELVGENGAAINAFDGNPNTFWHSHWYTYTPPYPPHEIQINLGSMYSIEGFLYLPRQDGGVNGRIANYEFYVSEDGVNWGNPVATGIFLNDATQKQAICAPKTGQFIRLRALSEVNGNPWTSMAELDVLGSVSSNGNQAPNGAIVSPNENITISAGDVVSFAGSANDPEGDLPLSYHWNFGSGSGIPDSDLQNPGEVTFNNPGTYTVSLTVTDTLGNVDTTPETRVITVRSITSYAVEPDWSNVSQSPFPLHESQAVVNPVLTASDVTDLNAQFVADPFLFYESGMWYMFFEVFERNTNIGRIGLATSPDGLNWTYDRIILEESFHLSFPSIIKSNGRYFMIPETSQQNEVRIYESTNFPYDWNYTATLVSGQSFVDPQIFYYNNTWWMFASDLTNSNCYLYYSDDLLSGWTSHPMSPIITNDSSMARGAGRSFVYNGNNVIRLAQRANYGSCYLAVRAFSVDILTKTNYVEHEISQSPVVSSPEGYYWNSQGVHHLDPWWTGSGWIGAVDGQRYGDDWSIGIYVSGESQ